MNCKSNERENAKSKPQLTGSGKCNPELYFWKLIHQQHSVSVASFFSYKTVGRKLNQQKELIERGYKETIFQKVEDSGNFFSCSQSNIKSN